MAYTPLKSVKEWLDALLEAVQSIKVLGAVRGILADLRVSVVNTPAVTVSSGTVTTVTTVSTLTNQAQVWGFLAAPQIPSLQNTTAVLSNIQNINITP